MYLHVATNAIDVHWTFCFGENKWTQKFTQNTREYIFRRTTKVTISKFPFFFGGSHGKNDAHLQLFFATNTACTVLRNTGVSSSLDRCFTAITCYSPFRSPCHALSRFPHHWWCRGRPCLLLLGCTTQGPEFSLSRGLCFCSSSCVCEGCRFRKSSKSALSSISSANFFSSSRPGVIS